MSKRVLRYALPLLGLMVVVAGCGSDSKSDKKSSTKVDKVTAAKLDNLEQAKKDFDKSPDDINACRNLAFNYTAVASPQSTGDPKKVPEPPKDREKNLKKAAETLEKCLEIKPSDSQSKQQLASAYTALFEYDKALPLLEGFADDAKNDPNAWYRLGIAASNAQNNKLTVKAWENFLKYAPKKDPRVKQVKASLKVLQDQK